MNIGQSIAIPSNPSSGWNTPPWIVWVQCTCFAILYSIWNYPLTNFLSDLCMIIGGSLSLYILYKNKFFFKTRQSIPFWLLVTLLCWIVFHLIFLSNNFELQFRELTNIWKRVVIAIIFALGFGVALSGSTFKRGYWTLFYIGMIIPTLIFLGKYELNVLAPHYGWILPDYLRLYGGRESVFYMYKVDYVSFCLPALAITLAQLKLNLEKGDIFSLANLMYFLAIFAVLLTFYLGNIKNGMVYSLALIVAFVMSLLNTEIGKLFKVHEAASQLKSWLFKLGIVLLLGFIAMPILSRHIEQNPSWKSLWADSKLAIQVDQIDNWKYWGAHGYPLNEYGNPVSQTNYERVAWVIVGVRLLGQNPLGYGLAENSFGHIAKREWPDSLLRQTHSGWLDLSLGIGMPGIGLLLSALLIVMYRTTKNAAQPIPQDQRAIWSSRLIWVLWAVLLLWCTSEISLKIHIIALIFWVSFGIGLSAPNDALKAQYEPIK